MFGYNIFIFIVVELIIMLRVVFHFVIAIFVVSNSFVFAEVKQADKNESVVIRDGGIEIGKDELENAIKYWPEKDRQKAISDDGERYRLLTLFMQNHKVAKEMAKITKETDPEFYWQREFAVRNLQTKLFLNKYEKEIKIPNMEALAKEYAFVHKDKFARTTELRKASHILFMCKAGICDRDEKKVIAEKVLKKLRGGASFEDMVNKYSDDPGSKARKGKLKPWIAAGLSRMDKYFVQGVYSIDKENDYSELINTKFGLHIIRLDEIQESSYRKEEEVLPGIIEFLEKKYRSLSKAAFMNNLLFTDNAFIDDSIVDELLSEYKVENKPTEKRRKVTIKKKIRPSQ